MKIAFISPDDLSTIIFCKSFAKILREKGIFKVYTISAVDKYKKELSEVDSIHIPVKMQRFVNPFEDLKYFLNLYRIIKREKFAMVVTFTTKPNIYGALAAKLVGTSKIIVAIRGLGQTFNDPTGVKDRFIHQIVSKLYRLSCGASTKVWFTNKNDRTYFVSHGIVESKKTLLTKNAVNLQDFCMESVKPEHLESLRREIGITESDRVVIMVARMIWPKGIKEFVDAARTLKKSRPDYKFLLIAPVESNSSQAVPDSYIHEMERDGSVIWLGFRKDVRELYAISNLAVLPSYYKEGGYPRALLEPMAMGKPVIAANTDDCKGPVEDGKNGYLVPVRDPKALSERIDQILTNDSMRERFGKYSLEKARKEFDDSVVIREVLSEIGVNSTG